MKQKSVAIVGYGAVGRGIHQLFPDAAIYDEPLEIGTREEVNRCEYAFVAVPTPMARDGSCDTSIVEDVVDWIESAHIILRSTVSVGTTEMLAQRYNKRIIFQPEYGPAETPDHPFHDLRNIRWIILGGRREHTIPIADLYKTTFSADVVIHQTDSATAELAKYMENCFLALKVTFCNEFYDIAGAFGIDYNELRELWLLDPRIGRSHTFVFPDARGYGGKCLPKDVSGLIQAVQAAGYEAELLEALQNVNNKMLAHNLSKMMPLLANGASLSKAA
jgi:UDPglucose 6-dehydrogenase